MSVSGNVLAQTPPAAPDPAQPAQPATPPSDQPGTAANPATPPTPGPPPVAAQPPMVAPPGPPATAYPTMAGPALKLSNLFTWRPGVFLQLWANFTQDAAKQPNGDSGSFTKNFYARRSRFFIGGTIGSNVSYFMLWETANLGAPLANADFTTNKQFTTFAFNDAYVDFKLNSMLSIQAGLMLIPFTRNILQSTSTYWALDVGAVSATYITATQTSTLRDTGVQVKVNAADNHFELRGMASEGVRQGDNTPATGAPARGAGKNDPRLTAFAQYNFLDPDTGYVFNGQYFGRKKILAVAAGADYQSIASNPYFATSATVAAAIPLHGGDAKNGDDEFGGQIEYLHFHGGGVAPGSTVAQTLFKQNAVLVEAGYYNKAGHFSLFGKFEGRFFDTPDGSPLKANNSRVYGVGAKYFLAEQIANLTLMYSLTQAPDVSDAAAMLRNDVNAIQLQLQIGYF
ncbi:MAG TPA: porin [Kofleriaceae bacterium]|jgi:hypothetical protein|nr:porin [Kofleriaceae bacterium]